MNPKNITSLLVGGGLILVGALVWVNTFRSKPIANNSVVVTPHPMEVERVADMSTRYVHYSPQAFDAASITRRILFFYASWCGECRPIDEELTKRASDIPEDVTVIRVNYSDPDTDQNEKDLAVGYGITYQHTFVQIDSAGKEVAKWNGGGLDKLLKNIK